MIEMSILHLLVSSILFRQNVVYLQRIYCKNHADHFRLLNWNPPNSISKIFGMKIAIFPILTTEALEYKRSFFFSICSQLLDFRFIRNDQAMRQGQNKTEQDNME